MRVGHGRRQQRAVGAREPRARAAYGFSAKQVADFVGMALRGSSLRDFHRDQIEVPVNVRFAGSEHYGAEDLQSFTVRTPDGRQVPLLAMVDVETRRPRPRSSA